MRRGTVWRAVGLTSAAAVTGRIGPILRNRSRVSDLSREPEQILHASAVELADVEVRAAGCRFALEGYRLHTVEPGFVLSDLDYFPVVSRLRSG